MKTKGELVNIINVQDVIGREKHKVLELARMVDLKLMVKIFMFNISIDGLDSSFGIEMNEQMPREE
jgi:uncharacterized membrane protein